MRKNLNEGIKVYNEDMKPVLTEYGLNYVVQSVEKLKKEWGYNEKISLDYIKGLYKDKAVLSIWNDEMYTPEKGEGFHKFEDFLIDYIEQSIQIDCY
ncbi:hypothetical protein ACV3V0_06095 [Clostridium perfringens]